MPTLAVPAVALIPPAPQSVQFHEITMLTFGQQMSEALGISDNRGPSVSDAARDFFRPRFDEQAAIVAAGPTPLLYATQDLSPVLCYEIFGDRGLTLKEDAPPPQLQDIFYSSVVPYAFALYESGLISRDPARTMIVALAEAVKQWDVPAYVAGCFEDVDEAYRKHVGLPPREGAASTFPLTDADRRELTHLPLEATMESLRWLVGFEQKTRFTIARRESDALIRRFDELSAAPPDPEQRAKRVDRARREQMRHDIRSYT